MKVQNIQSNNINFEARFTKKSIKFLKQNLSEITKDTDYITTKKALENLLQAKNRNDNLLIDIHKDIYGFGLIDYAVREINSKSKFFYYLVLTPLKDTKHTDAQKFLTDAEFINSEKFVKESNRVIMINNTRWANLPFWKKLEEKCAAAIQKYSNLLGEIMDKTVQKLIRVSKTEKADTKQQPLRIVFSKKDTEKMDVLKKLIDKLAE